MIFNVFSYDGSLLYGLLRIMMALGIFHCFMGFNGQFNKTTETT